MSWIRQAIFVITYLCAQTITLLGADDDPKKSHLEVADAEKLTVERGQQTAPGAISIINELNSASERFLDNEGTATFHDGNSRYVVINLEFGDVPSCQRFNVPGTKVITRLDRFADAFAKADEATAKSVSAANGLRWFDISRTDVFPPPARPVPRKELPRAAPEPIVRNGVQGLSGKGVIIAVIDSGVDFRHPDLINYDTDEKPTSRLLYFWDTGSDAYANGVGSPAPYSFPNGAPIGTIYNRQVLTADIRSGQPRIPVWDPNGHGTACAGIAAGNGKVNKNYVGVAPNAEIIAVRAANGSNLGMSNAYLIHAICEWLDSIAGEHPMVITCSWGGQFGGHDGHMVTERHLNARFPPAAKARAICFAAGNDGFDPFHSAIAVGPKERPAKINWTSNSPGRIEVFVQCNSEADIFLGRQGSTEISNVRAYVHGLSNHVVIELTFGPGAGGIFLYSRSGADHIGDAYVYGREARFAEECVELGKQVGSPGSAANVLTVGSYDWNDQFSTRGQLLLVPDLQRNAPLTIGSLSTYSSPGPLRFGDVWKPEIVAPGQWFTAPAPLNVVANRDSSGLYQLFNGTSAATPYAAGVVALLMEANPNLTFGEIRRVLIESVTQDAMTRTCPNPRWGYGKLDYAAVERAIRRAKP